MDLMQLLLTHNSNSDVDSGYLVWQRLQLCVMAIEISIQLKVQRLS